MTGDRWQAVARYRAAQRHGYTRVSFGRGRVAFGRTDAEAQRKHERLNREVSHG